MGAFREVVARANQSTVRVQCASKDTALGLVIDEKGWILTKSCDLKDKITCKLRDGRVLDARLVGIHKDNDLALLKIEASGLVPIEFSDSKGTLAGAWVACAGLGAEPVAIGVVSVPTRAIPDKSGFDLPPADAGYLGVAPGSGNGGVRILQVLPKTGADKAGLKADDIVILLAGKAVSDPKEFAKEIQKFKMGQEITLKVKRADKEMDIKITLGKRPVPRVELQNRMGSQLSSRRTGYPMVLQFDGLIKPADCGGPLVDLEGKVIGMSICRAGRVENWAVPAEAIKPLLADLKAGKYPPPEVVVNIPSEKLVQARSAFAKAKEELDAAQKKLAKAKAELDKAEAESRKKKEAEPEMEMEMEQSRNGNPSQSPRASARQPQGPVDGTQQKSAKP
jgi:serine protease Do